MITIRPVYNLHKMTFSNPGSGQRGFSVEARTLMEVHNAINHYYNADRHGLAFYADCPLCRKNQERE